MAAMYNHYVLVATLAYLKLFDMAHVILPLNRHIAFCSDVNNFMDCRYGSIRSVETVICVCAKLSCNSLNQFSTLHNALRQTIGSTHECLNTSFLVNTALPKCDQMHLIKAYSFVYMSGTYLNCKGLTSHISAFIVATMSRIRIT
jgi:hypothetical protein